MCDVLVKSVIAIAPVLWVPPPVSPVTLSSTLLPSSVTSNVVESVVSSKTLIIVSVECFVLVIVHVSWSPGFTVTELLPSHAPVNTVL